MVSEWMFCLSKCQMLLSNAHLQNKFFSDWVARVKGPLSVTTRKWVWSLSTIMRWGKKNLSFHCVILLYDSPFPNPREKRMTCCRVFATSVLMHEKKIFSWVAEISSPGFVLTVECNSGACHKRWREDYTKGENSKIQCIMNEINHLSKEPQGLTINMYLKRAVDTQVHSRDKLRRQSRREASQRLWVLIRYTWLSWVTKDPLITRRYLDWPRKEK